MNNICLRELRGAMSRRISRLGREKGAEISQTRVSKCTVAMVTAIKQASLKVIF